MARPKKIVAPIEETPVVETPVEETPIVEKSERSPEYYRLLGVYDEFAKKYPDKWEREKEVLLAKLINL